MQFQDLLDKGVTFIPYGPPLAPQDIARWETIINAPFPEQYRDYLLHANGGAMRISPKHERRVNCYGFDIRWPEGLRDRTPGSLLGEFFMIQDIPTGQKGFTLTFDYNYNAWKDVLPPNTFPIATDPGGAYLLIGLKGENRGKIYFWMLDSANPMDTPEIAAYAYMGWVADSFVEFVLSLEYMD